MSTWNIQLISDWDSIWEAQHLQRWQAHMDTAEQSHVFFHPALIRAWVETYLPLRSLRPLFLWARSTDGNTAMLPLVLWRRNWKNAWMKMIIPMGYSDFDYHDPIFHRKPDSNAADDFWSSVEKALKEIDHDQIELDGLHAASAPSHWLKKGEEPCPFIDLHEMKTLDDYLATRHKKMRYNLRRQQKKAEEGGPISYTVYDASSLNTVLLDLPTLLDYHRNRWPQAYKAPHFHRNILTRGLESGIAHFSCMKVGDTSVSWRLGFIYRDRYYSYMPILHPDHLALGAGKLHLLFCIQTAIGKGLSVYDQLRGSELYKSEWTNLDEEIATYSTESSRFRTSLKTLLLKLRGR